MNFDCIVIGGGIVGITTARELAIKGANVAIFDRGQLGLESSWAAGGIISSMRPWAESEDLALLSEHSKKIYPGYIEELKKDSDIDPEYMKSGLVIIDESHAKKTKRWAENKKIKYQDSFHSNLSNIKLPNYSVLLPDIAQVRPPRLLASLKKSLENLSVSIYENTEIKDLSIKNNEFHSVIFDQSKVTAESVIITAGAWSKSILSNIDIEIGAKPIRGQMLCLKPDKLSSKKMILDDSHYAIPRKDGHLLIGSTMEDVGFVNNPTDEGKEDLLNWAFSIDPCLKKAKLIRHWSGLRPSTTIDRPLIGRLPDFKNIYMNTGHFRKGILQAPASAQLLVDFMSGNPSFMDIEKFNIDYSKISLEIA